MVETLLSKDISVDTQDSKGLLPIDIADQYGRDKILQRLMKANAAEPSIWKMPRISDQAHFIAFDSIAEAIETWVRECLTDSSVQKHMIVLNSTWHCAQPL